MYTGMSCTNTLRKVMTQLPLTTKDVNNIKAIKGNNVERGTYNALQGLLQLIDVRRSQRPEHVTGFEKIYLSHTHTHTQYQDTLFTIKRQLYTLTNNSGRC